MGNILNKLILPKKAQAQAPDIYRPKRKLDASPIIQEAPIVLKNNKKTQVSDADLGNTDLKTSRILHK